jgi:glucokinase
MSARQVIAVDVGGTKLAAGLVDRDGAVTRRAVEPTERANDEALLAQLERVVAGVADGDFAALGVGIPSGIDQRFGRVVASVNIPLAGVDLRDRLEDRFGVPVWIENDANAAVVAEHRFGAARGARHVVMLTLGTGVGGGLILDDRLYRGAVGSAGELGHLTLDFDGPPCQGACPGRGHLEVLASGEAADRLADRAVVERPGGDLGRAAAAGRVVNPHLLVELASAGGEDALDVFEHVGFLLGVGISDLVNIFNPELVVIGGGFAEAGDLLLEPARKVVAERSLRPAADVVEIVEAELGPDAGLVGAGLLAFDTLDGG